MSKGGSKATNKRKARPIRYHIERRSIVEPRGGRKNESSDGAGAGGGIDAHARMPSPPFDGGQSGTRTSDTPDSRTPPLLISKV